MKYLCPRDFRRGEMEEYMERKKYRDIDLLINEAAQLRERRK